MADGDQLTGRAGYDLTGPEDAPLLVLLGSLGTSREVWDGQIPAFRNWFRVLRVELPGHDGARAPKGPYTVEGLGRRVVSVLDTLGASRALFAGLSLGGLIAMWLAAEHPERVERLAVCCSAPRFGPSAMWVERAEQVRATGTAPLVQAALGRWFTPAFLTERPDVASRYGAVLSGVDPEGYASCCDALATADVTADLGRVQAPTLVLAGAEDPVVPPESATATMKAVRGSSLCVLAGAAHLANVEQPDTFNRVVLDHLAGPAHERGLAVRRAVLGDAHVDRALARATELSAPWQDFLNGWPWGDVSGPARSRTRNPPAGRHLHPRRPGARRRAGTARAGRIAGRAQHDDAARSAVADGGVCRRAGGEHGLCHSQPGVGGGRGRTGRGLGRRCGFWARLLLLGALRDSGRVSCRFSTSMTPKSERLAQKDIFLTSKKVEYHVERVSTHDQRRKRDDLTGPQAPDHISPDRTAASGPGEDGANASEPWRLGPSRRRYSTVTSVPIGSMPKTT